VWQKVGAGGQVQESEVVIKPIMRVEDEAEWAVGENHSIIVSLSRTPFYHGPTGFGILL